ncbi:MAG: hypothetical protein ACJ8AU_12145 [Gemmatimonadales bacterium]
MLAKTLQESIDAWAGFYQDSTPTQIGMQFLHIGGLLGAGGLAISSDRDLIRQRSADPARRVTHLAHQRGVHSAVLAGLAIVTLSGLGFLFADLDTYLVSTPFWIKMALVAALIVNGVWMVRLERTLVAEPTRDREWARMRLAAILSVVLWFATTLLGAVLTNAA